MRCVLAEKHYTRAQKISLIVWGTSGGYLFSSKGMRIIFVRHAESYNNARVEGKTVNDDTELTELWHQQALRLAKRLEHEMPDYIVCSPKIRAVQTAWHIADMVGIEPVIIENFQERKWGERWGCEREEVKDRLSPMNIEERYKFAPPEAESREDMENRLLLELNNIVSLWKECVVIVTHKWCLRALMRVLLKGDLADHEKFDVAVASCSIVSYNNGEYDLESRNEISYL